MDDMELWRDAERAWQDYRQTRDLGRLREEILTSPLIADVPGESSYFVYQVLADKDVTAAKLLIELGVLDVQASASDGYHLLHSVIENCGDDPTMVNFLIEHGADIEKHGVNGWTPLHMAAIRGHVRVVTSLLDHGAGINARTEIDGGLTPLMKAAWAGQIDTARLLLERGANPNLADTFFGRNAAQMAEENEKHEVADLIWAHSQKAAWMFRGKMPRG